VSIILQEAVEMGLLEPHTATNLDESYLLVRLTRIFNDKYVMATFRRRQFSVTKNRLQVLSSERYAVDLPTLNDGSTEDLAT
jgi:hypothetical protein